MRGLKFHERVVIVNRLLSHPIRDAWIEINLAKTADKQLVSRIPYGMRGLKLLDRLERIFAVRSHPIRDAWIEMCH